jgi:hypothetical protein
MRSFRVVVYCAIVIGFARKILAKVSKPPRKEKRYHYDCSPDGLVDSIAEALCIPKSRFRLIDGETPNSVQVAFKDKKLGDMIAKRMWQSIPPAGDPNAFKAYMDLPDAATTPIKVYQDTRC